MSGLYQRTTESLEGLTDVDITNIQNGQAPVYDATQQVYTNQTVLTPSSLPTGSSGDVIISNGTGGIESTFNLNVNPSTGIITGGYVNVSSTTIKLGEGALTATDAVGVGWNAGFGSSNLSVSVGSASGTNAGSSSVSLGFGAQAKEDNCIVLNASGAGLQSAVASSCKIAPIRNINATTLTSPYVIQYDDTTKEVIKSEDLHARDIKCRDINNTGTLTNQGIASLWNGQLTIGGGKVVAGAGNNNLVVDLTNQKVGINKATPATELEVVGEARISSNGTQTLSFYDTAHNHEHGTIEAHQAGLGGRMEFSVKNVSSGAITRRLNINETGSIAIGAIANYGSTNQVLTSNGDAPPSWNNLPSGTPIFGGLFVSQNITVPTDTDLTFTTQVATGITATSSGFTCILAGWYNINFVIRLTTSGTTATSFLGSDLILKVNGVIQVVTSIQDAGSPYESAGFHSGGCLVELITGDTISFTCKTPQVSTNFYSLNGRVSLVKVD